MYQVFNNLYEYNYTLNMCNIEQKQFLIKQKLVSTETNENEMILLEIICIIIICKIIINFILNIYYIKYLLFIVVCNYFENSS